MDAKTLRALPYGRGVEVGALQEHFGGTLPYLGVAPPHDAGKGHTLLPVTDGEVGRGEDPLLAVQGDELLVIGGGGDNDPAAGEELEVEGVQRVAVFKEHVVGHVHDVVDGADAGGAQPVGEPGRGVGQGAAGYVARGVARAELGGQYLDLRDAVDGSTGLDDIETRVVHLLAELRGDLAGDADHAQAVCPVRGEADLEDHVLGPQRVEERGAELEILREDHDPGGLGGKLKLLLGAEHAAGFLAADLGALDLEVAGEGRADLGQRHLVARLEVLGAADDV